MMFADMFAHAYNTAHIDFLKGNQRVGVIVRPLKSRITERSLNNCINFVFFNFGKFF